MHLIGEISTKFQELNNKGNVELVGHSLLLVLSSHFI